MIVRLTTAFALMTMLGACDRFNAPEKQPNPDKKVEATSDRKDVNQPVEDAMRQIPPELRVAYHEAFKCELVANKTKGGTPIKVTPAYVKDLTARLRADPNIAKC